MNAMPADWGRTASRWGRSRRTAPVVPPPGAPRPAARLRPPARAGECGRGAAHATRLLAPDPTDRARAHRCGRGLAGASHGVGGARRARGRLHARGDAAAGDDGDEPGPATARSLGELPPAECDRRERHRAAIHIAWLEP